MTIPLTASLQLLSRSFLVQALVATAIIAIVSAFSPVATADPATVLPSPTNWRPVDRSIPIRSWPVRPS